ncbi:MAG: AAA family ATPase, partial [Tissierella sp.]|nr:AAA family ATPase [Tissierella sp.]
MKYLKTVILENFQSHKYTTIDFDQGLNVILGPSDSGKSAIIRGIKWALYNEPSGDYFIREGEREASVTLIFSDNTKVQRLRNKSKNSYILYKKNGEEIKFEGFGTSVPEEIIDEIGIKKIRLDSEESNSINLGEQLEGPFLLSEKTSTRAGAIGRLIGVNVIDDALKETLKDLRNASVRKKDTEDRILKIENELKEYEYLDELQNRLNKVEILRYEISKKFEKRDALIKYNSKYNEINKDLYQINYQLNQFKNIDLIDPLLENAAKYINRYKYLNIKRTNFENYQIEISRCDTLMCKLEGIDDIDHIIMKSKNILINTTKLLDTKFKLNGIIKEKNRLNNIYSSLDNLPAAERTLSSFEKKPVIISRLVKLRNDFNQNQTNLKTGNSFIKEFDGLEKSQSIYKDIENLIIRLTKLSNLSYKILNLKNSLNKEIQEYNQLNRENKIQLNNYKDLLNNIEKCPLCLS